MEREELNANLLLVRALISDDVQFILQMLEDGLDQNIQITITTDDLVEAWDRRLKRKYVRGWGSYGEFYPDEDLIEMNTIEMIGILNIGVDDLVTSVVETQPLLMLAIRLENFELVLRLLDLDVNVNSRDASGYTPLFYAIDKKNNEIVVKLLLKGADANLRSNSGVSPLLAALRTRNNPNVSALVRAGADIEELHDEEIFGSAIQFSIMAGEFDCFTILKEAGANMKFVNSEGDNLFYTLLRSWKAKNFDAPTASLVFSDLILGGAQLDKMQHYPKIPGHFYSYGTVEILQLMLDNGMEVVPQGFPDSSMPALHVAACNPSKEVLQFLIYHKRLDLELQDRLGRSVLCFAYSEPHSVNLENIKLLVDHGADLNTRDLNRRSLLEVHILSNTAPDSFTWLLKRCSIENIKCIIPILNENNKNWQLRQVYKHLAVLKHKEKIEDIDSAIQHSSDVGYFHECIQELTRMDAYFVCGRKLIDFVAAREYSLIARKTHYTQTLKALDLSELFPIYWSELLTDFKEASARQSLVLAALPGLKRITGFSYKTCPQLFDQVTYYLSEIDLTQLSEV